jgi:hypothetical protein
MDEDIPEPNGIVTSVVDNGRKFLTWFVSEEEVESETSESAPTPESAGPTLTRRSYVATAGAATVAGLAGCTGGDATSVTLVSGYTYGGSPILSQASSVSVSVTESEPNDMQANADSIGLGTTVEGELTSSDVDWYAVDIQEGTEVAVEFSRDTDSVTAVILYDADGEFLNLRYAGTEDTMRFTATVEQSGTNFLQVVDTEGSDGSYTLTVSEDTESTPTTTTTTATPTTTTTTTTTTATTTTATTTTATPTATTPEDDYGEQGYGQYGYGGVSTS